MIAIRKATHMAVKLLCLVPYAALAVAGFYVGMISEWRIEEFNKGA